MLVLWVEGHPPALQPLPNEIAAFLDLLVPLIESGHAWAVWEVDCVQESVTPLWPLWATQGTIEIGERSQK